MSEGLARYSDTYGGDSAGLGRLSDAFSSAVRGGYDAYQGWGLGGKILAAVVVGLLVIMAYVMYTQHTGPVSAVEYMGATAATAVGLSGAASSASGTSSMNTRRRQVHFASA